MVCASEKPAYRRWSCEQEGYSEAYPEPSGRCGAALRLKCRDGEAEGGHKSEAADATESLAEHGSIIGGFYGDG